MLAVGVEDGNATIQAQRTFNLQNLGIDRLQEGVIVGGVEQAAIGRIRPVAIRKAAVVCLSRQFVQFEGHVRDRHQDSRKMGRVEVAEIGIAHHQVGERIGLQQIQQVHALGTAQDNRSRIAVLEVLHLVFENIVERRAELAAEFVDFLGKAADPQIDMVQSAQTVVIRTGRAVRSINALRIQEVDAVEGRLNRVRNDWRIRRPGWPALPARCRSRSPWLRRACLPRSSHPLSRDGCHRRQ